MPGYELSILIPARNERFLRHTIDDLLANIRANTEIVVVFDGTWPFEGIEDRSNLTIIYHSLAVGQRAACNEAARIASGKWLMKLDAHCSVEEGFDAKLLEVIQSDWTLVPNMKNLHAFDWVCGSCDWRDYQGPDVTVCPKCGGKVDIELIWKAKRSPNSHSYCFDSEPHFQYFGDWNKRPQGKGDITETMSLQGSCFMISRDRYFDLNVCDEKWGSWGSQGIEVACKSWLSGGKVMCLHTTWYAHMFRTRPGFAHPYPLGQNQVDYAKRMARELFFTGRWDKAVRPLSWLLEYFWPVKGWTDEDLLTLKVNESKLW